MSRNVIDDGFTKQGFLKKVDRLHDEMSFLFRPMLPEQVEALEQAIDRNSEDPKKVTTVIAAAIVQQLKNWSESTSNGDALPITIDNIRRLHPAVLGKLRRIVQGLAAYDEREVSTAGRSDGGVPNEYERLAADEAGVTTLQEQQKN